MRNKLIRLLLPLLCLFFVFSASGFSVPQTVQAEDGGYLLDKVIEWADGTTERIQIGDDGFFVLDGVRRRLVAMDLANHATSYDLEDMYWLPDNLAIMDKVLTSLQSMGIRLVEFNPRYLSGYGELGNEHEVYSTAFDLIYEHKMLVMPHIVGKWLAQYADVSIAPDFSWPIGGGDYDSMGAYAERFADVVAKYPNVVAVVLGNELNNPFGVQEYPAAEVQAYLHFLADIFRSRVNVPMVHNSVGRPSWHPDTIMACLAATDWPCFTHYAKTVPESNSMLATLVSWLGEQGYPTTGWWMEETNKVGPIDASAFTVDYIESAFVYGASIVYLHTSISPDDPGYSFFDNNGVPIPSMIAIGAELERLQAPIDTMTAQK